MTKRATFRQADVTRAIRGARAAGLPDGSFKIEIVDGRITLLPIAANEPLNAADDVERRMKDAFGE